MWCLYVMFVDVDVCLSVRVIEQVVTRFKETAVTTGLVMKESKTKYVKIIRNITNL